MLMSNTEEIVEDRVMYARSEHLFHRPPVVGGEPITAQIASELRNVVFGSSCVPARGEWMRTAFVFEESGKDDSLGLKAVRNSTRGLISTVQAYLMKHLFFSNKDNLSFKTHLCSNKIGQMKVLSSSLCDILWKVGENVVAVVVLPQQNVYVPHSLTYFHDSVTEKLHCFHLRDFQELEIFIKRYLYLFQEEPGPGALLLLYSAILTRGIEKVREDLMDAKSSLVMSEEEGTVSLVMLLLTGRATSFLHNGIIYVGDEENYAKPHFGVLTRGEIGFLIYSDEESETASLGSRLKTPSLPIWVVSYKGHYGVIFSPNRELLRNYHAERRFDLIYYSCGGHKRELTVDTRSNEENLNSSVEGDRCDGFKNSSALKIMEKIVRTKWPDARVRSIGQ